jgi:hypothetical protein
MKTRRKTSYRATDLRKYSESQIVDFRALVDLGATQQAAARIMGIPEGSAWYLAKRAKV